MQSETTPIPLAAPPARGRRRPAPSRVQLLRVRERPIDTQLAAEQQRARRPKPAAAPVSRRQLELFDEADGQRPTAGVEELPGAASGAVCDAGYDRGTFAV